MADVVDTYVIESGPRNHVVRLVSQSDGTGETDVVKVDVSALAAQGGRSVSHLAVDAIEYSVTGFNYVTLEFDATTDDPIAVLSGQGLINLKGAGGFTDPESTGFTGDILLTTDGAVDGAAYDITLHLRKKY